MSLVSTRDWESTKEQSQNLNSLVIAANPEAVTGRNFHLSRSGFKKASSFGSRDNQSNKTIAELWRNTGLQLPQIVTEGSIVLTLIITDKRRPIRLILSKSHGREAKQMLKPLTIHSKPNVRGLELLWLCSVRGQVGTDLFHLFRTHRNLLNTDTVLRPHPVANTAPSAACASTTGPYLSCSHLGCPVRSCSALLTPFLRCTTTATGVPRARPPPDPYPGDTAALTGFHSLSYQCPLREETNPASLRLVPTGLRRADHTRRPARAAPYPPLGRAK